EPVQIRTAGLEHDDAALTGDRHGLLEPVVHIRSPDDVERGRGHALAQRLEHRVPPSDGVLARLLLATGRLLPALLLLSVVLALVRLVVRAVLRLGRGALALELSAAVAAGALRGPLLALAARSAA